MLPHQWLFHLIYYLQGLFNYLARRIPVFAGLLCLRNLWVVSLKHCLLGSNILVGHKLLKKSKQN
jgi:hypothetical protein